MSRDQLVLATIMWPDCHWPLQDCWCRVNDQSRGNSVQSSGFYFSSMYQVFPWGGRVRQRLGLRSLLLSHGFASHYEIFANSSRNLSCSIVGRQCPIVARSFTALLGTAILNPIDLYSFWGWAVLWAVQQLRRLSAVCVLLVIVSNIVRRIKPFYFLVLSHHLSEGPSWDD